MMSRSPRASAAHRRGLGWIVFAAWGALLGGCDARAAEPSVRPNVLWIVVDQHRADVAGYAGNSFASTPSLDLLASQSVRLTACYSQAPLCAPARQSMLTGQFVHSHGAFRNRDEFPAEQRTLAHAFAASGYATALVGKAHCNTNGFEYVREFEAQLAEFLERNPDGQRPGAEHYRFRKSGGFEFARTMNPENQPAGDGPRFFMEQAVVEDTLAFLEQRDDPRPFFVWASFLNPHPPLYAPDAFRELFVDARLPVYGSLEQDEVGLLAVNVQRRADQDLAAITDAQLSEITRAYYAALAWTDDCVGRLLAGLDELGLAQDTLVVYTSDHGELLGEHSLLQKRSFFEGASRVPCMLRWPGQLEAGAVRTRVVQHVDLTATVLDLAGVPPPNPLDGRSMRALLADPGAAWEDFALAELQDTSGSGEVRRMLRLGSFKYIRLGAGEEALFDLASDPGERSNLIDRPEHAARIERLRARVAALGGDTPGALSGGK